MAAGIVASATALLAEGFALFALQENAGLATVAMTLGVGFLYVVIPITLFTIVTFVSRNPREINALLSPSDSEERVGRTAWLLYWGAQSVVILIGSAWLATYYIDGFTQKLSVSLACALTTGAAFVVAWLLAPLGEAIISRMLSRLPATVAHPRTVIGISLFGAIAAHVAFATLRPTVFAAIPWHLEFAVWGGALGAFLIAQLSERIQAIAVALSIGFGLIGSGIALFAYPNSERVVFSADTIGGSIVSALHDRLDADGDGSLALYGENDCAPHDPSVHPNALEIVGNGVDENCNGIDLSEEVVEMKRGATRKNIAGIKNRKPNVILITTDSLSFSRTSLGRTDRDTTPHLAEWAKEATVFDAAFGTSNATRLAIPGIVLGKHNANTKMVGSKHWPYPYKGEKTITQRLQKAGYETVFVPGDRYFWQWKSLRAGFDRVLDETIKSAADPKHTAVEVTDTIVRAIETRDRERPLFLWAHYYDHHVPFNPPDHFKKFGDSKADKHDSEIHFADAQWKRVFETLDAEFEPDDLLVIFTSDHGEVFDRPETKKTHSVLIDHEVLHVPLIMQGPKGRGLVVTTPVSHLDIVPTVANVVGWKEDPLWAGQTLVDILYGSATEGEADHVVSLEYVPNRLKKGLPALDELGLHTETHYLRKRFQSPSATYLTNWRTDPFGREDLSATEPELFEVLNVVALRKRDEILKNEKSLIGTSADKYTPKMKKKQKKKKKSKKR